MARGEATRPRTQPPEPTEAPNLNHTCDLLRLALTCAAAGLLEETQNCVAEAHKVVSKIR